ncbi:MAG: hypothetical protein ABWZ76_11750 [Acidimicrobiales bacterium]
MALDDEWVWRRWQLVLVDEHDGELIVDAIELVGDPRTDSGALITLSFGVASPGDGDRHELVRQLEGWATSDDGICHAVLKESSPFGCLALFHGGDSVIVATAPPR